MNFKGFPEDVEINPMDIDGFAFKKDFRTPQSGLTINKTELILQREDYKRMEVWRKQEYGRFQNPPLTITSDGGFEYAFYFDLGTVKIKRNTMRLSIEARKSERHFFENAKYLLFDLVSQKGGLDEALGADVPYIIVPDLLELQRIVAWGTELSLLYQLYTIALSISQTFATLADITFVLATAIQLVALALFLFLTLVGLYQASINLKELYYPTLRYFRAFSHYDLINSACVYLGYVFESNELETELRGNHALGVPLAIEGKSIVNIFQNDQAQYHNLGYPTDQDTTPTLWSLIEWYLKQYGMRIFVFNGVVKMEKRTSFMATANVRVRQTISDQDDSEDEFMFNGKPEIWGRSYQKWRVDFSDVHSPDVNDGMKVEHITQAIDVYADDLVNLTGLSEDGAPFSLAGRKEGFTETEILVNKSLTLINKVINAVGGNPLPNNVSQRDGVMIIEHQYFEVTKILTGTPVLQTIDGIERRILKQPSNYKDILSMDTIYENYRKALEVDVNSYKVKTMNVPFTDENFISLIQNNFFIDDETGDILEAKEIVWFDRKKYAKIVFILPDDSLINTETIKLA